MQFFTVAPGRDPRTRGGLGLGLKLDGYGLDYAYEAVGALGSTNDIQWNYSEPVNVKAGFYDFAASPLASGIVAAKSLDASVEDVRMLKMAVFRRGMRKSSLNR